MPPPAQFGRDPRARALAAAGVTFAVLLLPLLAAGTGIDDPVTVAEVGYLQHVRGFAADVPADLERYAHDELHLGTARLLQVLAVGAIGGVTYLTVVLARGRVQALLACVAFALLPPVATAGSLVRPEGPATLLAGFVLLLLQCFAQTALRHQPASGRHRTLSLLGLGGCAAFALALATAELPSLGAQVLLPGVVLTLGATMLLLRTVRSVRRRGWMRLPHRAWNRRLLPWTALALATPAVVLLVFAVTTPDPLRPGTAAVAPLVPGTGPTAVVTWLLLGLGAGASVLRIGLRFGRGGRIGAELVLLVYCAVELAATVGAPPAVDRLPAAPALAIVLAEGVRVVLAGLWLVVGRRAFAELMT